MAADLHIHAMVDVTEDDLKCFFASTLGSRFFNPSGKTECDSTICKHWDKVTADPHIWIGEVSWLKAALLEDDDFIPEPVEKINELIGEDLPVLDEALKNSILDALKVRGDRGTGYDVRSPDNEDLIKWLDANMGRRLFTVSW